MPVTPDPNANPSYPERDAAPETGQPASPTTEEGGTPPRPAPVFDSRPAAAAPKIRIQRGATVYAPWRRGGAPPSPAPTQTPPPAANAPQTPAAPPQQPLNYATPAVAPTVVIRPAPGSQHWTATETGTEPTIEMTVEFAAVTEEELAQEAGVREPEKRLKAEVIEVKAAEPMAVEAMTPDVLPASPLTTEIPAPAIAFAEATPAPEPAVITEPTAVTPTPLEARSVTPVVKEAEAKTEAETPAPLQAEATITPAPEEAPPLIPPPPQLAKEEILAPAAMEALTETPLVAETAKDPLPLFEPEPEPPAPVVAENLVTAAAAVETLPVTEIIAEEAVSEPIPVEPIAETSAFPDLDNIPAVPEIALIRETLPLTAAVREAIPALEPSPIRETPVAAEMAEAVSETQLEIVSIVAPPTEIAAMEVAPLTPEEIAAVAVPIAPPDVETVASFAEDEPELVPIETEPSAITLSPQEAAFRPEPTTPPLLEAVAAPSVEETMPEPASVVEAIAEAPRLAESFDTEPVVTAEIVQTPESVPTEVEVGKEQSTGKIRATEEITQRATRNAQQPIPAPAFDAHLDVIPVLPTTRRAPGTPAPPVAQTTATPETAARPRGFLRPNRRPETPKPDIETMNRAAVQPAAPALRLPPPTIPGYRQTRQERAEAERLAREEEERQEVEEWTRFRSAPLPLSPAQPGAARFYAVVGLILAALGLLARPLADATNGTAPFAAVAHFTDALEGDSRMQWRNLQRRPEGRALSASSRTDARVVVILAEQRRGAARDEYPMGRLELARLIRLCHDAGVPAIAVAADTASLPLTTGIAVGGPQRRPKQGPDPLAVAIRDIRQASADAPRPTFTVLPALFGAKTPAGKAPVLTIPDPLLPRKGVVTGFMGPSPAAPDAINGAKGNAAPLRRSFALSARVAAPYGKAGTAAAVSMPAALAFLTLPNAALWPQARGTETADSDTPRGFSAVFAYPKPNVANGKPGERSVAIDFGLLQSDPEGVQVISVDYVASLTPEDRKTLLERRPVVIGLDRPADRIQTPLSSPRFVVFPPVKPTMARAEAEGRAAAMLLARAERTAQPGTLAALASGEDALLERPGRIFSAGSIPPPAPYMAPVPRDNRSWIAFPLAALLGYLLVFAGRRLAAPPVKNPKGEPKGIRSSARIWGDLERRLLRAAPVIFGIALAAALGWLWRVYGTPGFAEYLGYSGFDPWAAPWASSLLTAGVFGIALIGMWMMGIVWRGKGVALLVAAAAFALSALAVQDFVLFPAWPPFLAPLGGFLLGAALRLGGRP